MKKLILLVSVCILSVSALSDTGIGVSFQGNDGRVYIPHDLSDSLRIEPSIRYYKMKFSNNLDVENYEIGIGLFYKKETIKNMRILIGARAGYIDLDQTALNASSGDGYFIAPALGFEYFIGEKFSIGGEVALNYRKTTQDTFNSFTGTDTSLSARFYF